MGRYLGRFGYLVCLFSIIGNTEERDKSLFFLGVRVYGGYEFGLNVCLSFFERF